MVLAVAEETVGMVVVALVAAVGLIGSTWVASRRGARSGAQEGSQALRDAVDTGNGKNLGNTVRDIAQTTELLQAQGHTNAGDINEVGQGISRLDEKLDRVHEKVDRIDGRVDRVEQKAGRIEDKLDGHITEMASRVLEHDEMVRKQREED